jgi:putative nucleotidyltransferase with HDIG domain
MVVDDDEAFAKVVADVLNERGYDALCVSDPERALEEAEQADFGAAVVDLVMPGLGGLELAAGLRARQPDLQVVLLTGHGSFDSAVEGIRQGIFAYLQKDAARIGVLEHTLTEALEHHRLLRTSKRLMEEVTEANRRLGLLHESALALAAEVHPDRILNKVVGLAAELCQARGARALVFQAQGHDVVVEAAAGPGAELLRGARLGAGESLGVLVARADAPLAVPDPLYHPRYSKRCDALKDAHLGLLCAPLRHAGVEGALLVAGSLKGAFDAKDLDMLSALGRQAAVALDGALQREAAANFFTHTSDILVSALETLDVHHPDHSRGTAALADLVTRRLGWSDAERRSTHFAALLHDIGKIRIDPALLQGTEFAEPSRRLMREHARLGADLLKPITAWRELPSTILSHHERWDGTGYPAGLSGEDIPPGARVVALADAFDAMRRETPYRRSKGEPDAIGELEAQAGRQFDPRMVRLFVAALRDGGDPRVARG